MENRTRATGKERKRKKEKMGWRRLVRRKEGSNERWTLERKGKKIGIKLGQR